MIRYIVLVCAVIMQLCLGATYSWSVYVAPLKSITGISQGGVQLPFSFFYFVFSPDHDGLRIRVDPHGAPDSVLCWGGFFLAPAG